MNLRFLLVSLIAWLSLQPPPATSVHVNAQLVPVTCTGSVTGDLTPGTLTLTPELNQMSFIEPFADANADGIASVQYQKHSGDTGYHDVYGTYLDRRVTVGGVANPNVNQARWVVIGLLENTSYDIKMTWQEGAGASSCVVATASTLTSAPPTGGTTLSVNSNGTLATALTTVNPGQTISVAAGTYSPFTISRSGNAGAWIVIDGGGVATVTGTGVNQNILLSANFIVLQNFILSASDFYGIIARSRNNVIIRNNVEQSISTLCTNAASGNAHYGDTGIDISGSTATAMVLGNSITYETGTNCVATPGFQTPGTGILFSDCTQCVIDGNTVSGQFRDAISSDDSTNAPKHMQITNNAVINFVDDGLESKGLNLNTAIWGNSATTTLGGDEFSNEVVSSAVSAAGGPTIFARNGPLRHLGNSPGEGGCVFKGPSGPTWFIHNSWQTGGTAGSTSLANLTCGNGSTFDGPYTFLNQAFDVTQNVYESATSSTVTADHNCGTQHSNTAWAFNYHGTNYTFAQWKATILQDLNSVNASPVFADTLLNLDVTSPCINKGQLLPNYNGADSLWPILGSAPDAGYKEKQ